MTLGLYIHIPWCLSRCPYCSFFADNYNRKDFDDYFATLLREKELWRQNGIPPLSSIYFGGGTPSLLSAQQIRTIVNSLELLPGAEITMELNPIQVTKSFASELADTPVNRLSLGVQSMLDDDLLYLGRRHRAADIPQKLQILRDAGFTNISADFIYGLPNSHNKKVCESLSRLLDIPFEHISCYLLELAEDCPLAADIPLLPDDDESNRQYQLIRDLLEEHGFIQYEISNFALPGRESRHNLLYWESRECLAWGASASGYYKGRRYQNPADLKLYSQYIASGRTGGDTDESAQEESDYIMMRLRLVKGLDYAEYQARFGKCFTKGREHGIRKLEELGFIHLDASGLRLLPDAFFISNAVITELL
ncbi:MAG: radical SAM family heme chaperone HemW [Candidatus Cloacimonetes bacterium]|jgi:oxygen-independent coproporphyrinogen-3 oxidase|nr:radical SAM family heme chaperone HemW [Candidatus Cloacimonadota bacterium]MDD2505759.1 radical SAM family heme chaperone HemW [Candidatus Cloacimonadota bacterium]MDD4146901.1 radical SAM family heme chaperone HemW [Candidatus Cloacimonadota bacterium]MDD4559181.1 radical SAM family heme chaperone HemW [Candidatus Cloacimonadota bacterium]